MANEREWSLFLDESGNFESESFVWIAGVMIQDSPDSLRHLKKRIRAALPHVPYPPHATELNLETFHLWAWRQPAEQARNTHPQVLLLERLWAWLQASRDPAAVRLRSAIHNHDKPSYEAFRDASHALAKEAPELHREARILRQEARAQIRSVLEDLAESFGPGRCFAIGAAERREEPFPSQEDRYLALLEVVFERVFALLREQPAERHFIRICPAIRHVRAGALPSAPMVSRDLARAIRKAEQLPLLTPTTPTDLHVRLVPGQPEPFDEAVHPGIVLADFVSNALLLPLSQAAQWHRVKEVASTSTALPVETIAHAYPEAGPLPTLAAQGPAREAVRAALEHKPHVPPVPAYPGWIREQAGRWIVAIRRHGGAR